jgi:hypothetical protein
MEALPIGLGTRLAAGDTFPDVYRAAGYLSKFSLTVDVAAVRSSSRGSSGLTRLARLGL